ncbi:hypothetical protein [Gordonia sp. (in: high G+C Gram-positive bacteria)]|uniref:hypothetical protein n=1 Tax=Gordonia sp. (in: high G+C Gram-positive bacteria) TaxID=84139 RepID=UPI003C78C1DD
MLISRLQALGLVVGPAIFALSPLFWNDGHYGVAGGMLIAVSTVPWVFGLLGEYEKLRKPFPVVSGLWVLLVLIGMFGTVAFGLQGFFEAVFGADNSSALAAFDGYPTVGTIMFLLAGPTFPFALMVFGAMLWRARTVPQTCVVAVLVAAVAFPIARVTREAPVAFIADLVMLAAFCGVAWYAWQRSSDAVGSTRIQSKHG